MHPGRGPAPVAGVLHRAAPGLRRIAPYAGYAASVVMGGWMLLWALSVQAYRGFVTPYTFLALLFLGVAAYVGVRLARRNRGDLARLFIIVALPLQVGYAFLMLPFAPAFWKL